MTMTHYDSEWEEVEQMLEGWIEKANLTLEQQAGLQEIREFISEMSGSDIAVAT